MSRDRILTASSEYTKKVFKQIPTDIHLTWMFNHPHTTRAVYHIIRCMLQAGDFYLHRTQVQNLCRFSAVYDSLLNDGYILEESHPEIPDVAIFISQPLLDSIENHLKHVRKHTNP